MPTLLDIGCGWEARLLQDIEPYISYGYGIDFKAPIIETEKIKTFEYTMQDKLPFENNSIDIVTMLAVLEHLTDPLAICKEISRILKRDGLLVITVPSKASKPVLEFLAYKLKIVSESEIRDHKEYFDKKSLFELFYKIENMQIMNHKYFQLGMNNFCVVKKNWLAILLYALENDFQLIKTLQYIEI